jgi:hypothetical protein
MAAQITVRSVVEIVSKLSMESGDRGVVSLGPSLRGPDFTAASGRIPYGLFEPRAAHFFTLMRGPHFLLYFNLGSQSQQCGHLRLQR